MPTRKLLTDKGVKALKPAASGKRYVVAAQSFTKPTTGTNTATRSETLLNGGRYAYGPSLNHRPRTLYRCAARTKRARCCRR
jgi:hypothetical protein